MPNTVYTGINLMLPTYMRSETRLPEFVDSAESTCADSDNIFYTFMLSRKDRKSETYLTKRFAGTNRLCILYENEAKPHLAKFWNRLYAETEYQDPSLMVSMVGDDMIFQSEYWDELLLDNCNQHRGIGLWFADDRKNTHDALMVSIFSTRRVVDGQKPLPFMCEAFPCDDMDVVWDHVARRLGIRYYLPDFWLFHNHATFKEENMDDTWRRLRGVFPEVVEQRKNMEQYVNERVSLLKKNIPELKEGKARPDVLMVCMGRYGDVIHASLHANRLIEMGYNIVWLTTPLYKRLLSHICPKATVKFNSEDDLEAWDDAPFEDIKAKNQGYDFYVHAQPGSAEHHSKWVGSGISMVEYVSRQVSLAIPIKIDNDLKRYAIAVDIPDVKIKDRTNKPLCIIAPHIISTAAAWPSGGVAGLYEENSKMYDVRILVSERPNVVDVPIDKYLFGYSFVQCISVIKQCSLFIGQDSGLSWAAIYSKCRKIIYHSSKRIKETNMLFGKVDPLAEDIIL